MFKSKAKVILDTNFLLIPGNFMVDIFTEIERIVDVPYELVVFKKTLAELKKILEKGNIKDKRAAKLGLALVKSKALKTLTSFSKKYVDDLIFSKAKAGDYVATQDKELKQRLREKNIKIITLKQKKYLVIECSTN